MSDPIDVSVLVPVGTRLDTSGALIEDYVKVLRDSDRKFELILILDGPRLQFDAAARKLQSEYSEIRLLQLTKRFGEATALSAGFEHSRGDIILTLPAYPQIEPGDVPLLAEALDDCDMAIGYRFPRSVSSRFEKYRRELFHWLVKKVGGDQFSDLGCGARAMRRAVLEEVPIYGDQHRFLPLLAARRGFKVDEVAVRQSEADRFRGRYGTRVYLRRLLDLMTIFFLIRFTKKPLRFFGVIGTATAVFGAVVLAYVIFERLFLGVALADRPALLLSSLLVTLGLQFFALGLLGELIIFTHAKDIKEYTIDKIVN